MRQVNQDELVHIIVSGLRDIGPGLLKQLADGRHLVQSDARHLAAKIIAGKRSACGEGQVFSGVPSFINCDACLNPHQHPQHGQQQGGQIPAS